MPDFPVQPGKIDGVRYFDARYDLSLFLLACLKFWKLQGFFVRVVSALALAYKLLKT
jgi:hypothetical protein